MYNVKKVCDDLDTAAAILRAGYGGRKHVALADSILVARKELNGASKDVPAGKPKKPARPAGKKEVEKIDLDK